MFSSTYICYDCRAPQSNQCILKTIVTCFCSTPVCTNHNLMCSHFDRRANEITTIYSVYKLGNTIKDNILIHYCCQTLAAGNNS